MSRTFPAWLSWPLSSLLHPSRCLERRATGLSAWLTHLWVPPGPSVWLNKKPELLAPWNFPCDKECFVMHNDFFNLIRAQANGMTQYRKPCLASQERLVVTRLNEFLKGQRQPYPKRQGWRGDLGRWCVRRRCESPGSSVPP